MATKRKQRLSIEELSEIANREGFPDFHAELQGFGNYIVFTNNKKCRVYNPKSGKGVYDYKNNPNKFSDFLKPEEIVSATPCRILDTSYNKDISCKYYKRS